MTSLKTTLKADHLLVLMYLDEVDKREATGQPYRRIEVDAALMKELADLGYVVWLNAPYPFALSHAHLTKRGFEALRSVSAKQKPHMSKRSKS